MGDLLTAETVKRWAKCPTCHATPGNPCVDNDQPRKQNHRQRASVARIKINEYRIQRRKTQRRKYNSKDD